MFCRTFVRATRRAVRDREGDLMRDLAVYWLVNAFLHVVNLITSPASYWAVWPALGWGLALALRAARQRRTGPAAGTL
ncbi:MAG: 2TM domain-containing protein [Hyphomicrobiales bacterium]|nr:2TM domain-containing protein [Hyphomicrobiales bacterium]MCP5373919.1 2TM domain-containing protein [Hyphomicrobiales bacterium]